jgi:hypothetical protein
MKDNKKENTDREENLPSAENDGEEIQETPPWVEPFLENVLNETQETKKELKPEDFLKQGYEQIQRGKKQIITLFCIGSFILFASIVGLYFSQVNISKSVANFNKRSGEMSSLTKRTDSLEAKTKDATIAPKTMLQSATIATPTPTLKATVNAADLGIKPETIVIDGKTYDLIADSVAQFSNEQGKYGWTYGFRPENSTEMWKFGCYDNGHNWWVSAPYIASGFIKYNSIHPHKTPNEKYVGPTIRRWTSPSDGIFYLSVFTELQETESKDGVTAEILVNGRQLWSKPLTVQSTHSGNTTITDIRIRKGDSIDFALHGNKDPIGDETIFTTKIYIKK